VIAGGSSTGTPPRQALPGYLAVRRSLGYKLDRPEKLLAQFIGYLEDAGAATVTTDHALAWATLPGGDANWHACRLAAARGFAIYLHTIDPSAEVPPAGLIPSRPRRPPPTSTPVLRRPAQQLVEGNAQLRPSRGGSRAARAEAGLLAPQGRGVRLVNQAAAAGGPGQPRRAQAGTSQRSRRAIIRLAVNRLESAESVCTTEPLPDLVDDGLCPQSSSASRPPPSCCEPGSRLAQAAMGAGKAYCHSHGQGLYRR